MFSPVFSDIGLFIIKMLDKYIKFVIIIVCSKADQGNIRTLEKYVGY